MARIIVTVPDRADEVQVCDYLEVVVSDIANRCTSGHYNEEHHWTTEGVSWA